MSTFFAEDNIMNEYTQKKGLYEQLSSSVLQIMDGLMKKAAIKYASIDYRIKNENSLCEKIRRKGDKYKSLSDITDIGGVRIITYYADDVDRVANLIEQEFKVDKENSIDKRKTLKPNVFGYLSLHYIISLDDRRSALPEYANLKELKIEVQIRSILQHSWAEMEHDMGYKSKTEIPEEIIRDFSRLAGLLEIADKEFQEIRKKIKDYESKVTVRMQSDRNDEEIKLDAVSLQVLLDNDKDFISLNQKIAKIAGAKISSGEVQYHILDKFLWLEITTVRDLKQLLAQRKDLAIGIAEEFLGKKKCQYLDKTIGSFYLCYAKLVTDFPKEQWKDYFIENHIGTIGDKTATVEKLYKASCRILEKDIL